MSHHQPLLLAAPNFCDCTVALPHAVLSVASPAGGWDVGARSPPAASVAHPSQRRGGPPAPPRGGVGRPPPGQWPGQRPGVAPPRATERRGGAQSEARTAGPLEGSPLRCPPPPLPSASPRRQPWRCLPPPAAVAVAGCCWRWCLDLPPRAGAPLRCAGRAPHQPSLPGGRRPGARQPACTACPTTRQAARLPARPPAHPPTRASALPPPRPPARPPVRGLCCLVRLSPRSSPTFSPSRAYATPPSYGAAAFWPVLLPPAAAVPIGVPC